MSVMSWLRSRFGPAPVKGVAGFRPARGPFDEPPAEPVELDPADLPWELRDEPGPDAR